MTIYVSMLRGINVGRNKRIRMNELRELYLSLNFKDVKTYIQSGNVIFKYLDSDPSDLEDKIQNKLLELFEFDVKVIIRTMNELKKVIAENPFNEVDTKHLYVTFLSDSPSEKLVNEIKFNKEAMAKNESDKYFISLSEVYLFLPGGYGITKLNNNFFEKKLNLSCTTRNWKTINKLFDIAMSISE